MPFVIFLLLLRFSVGSANHDSSMILSVPFIFSMDTIVCKRDFIVGQSMPYSFVDFVGFHFDSMKCVPLSDLLPG